MSMEAHLKSLWGEWVDVAVSHGYIPHELAAAAKADVVFIQPSAGASARAAARIKELASRKLEKLQLDIVSEDSWEGSPDDDIRKTMLEKMLSQPLTHLRTGDVILKALATEGLCEVPVGVWCRDAEAKSAFLRRVREHDYEIRLVAGVMTVFDKQKAFKVKVADEAVWSKLVKEMQYV